VTSNFLRLSDWQELTQSHYHISLLYSYIWWLASFQEIHHLSLFNALKCPLNGPIFRLPFRKYPNEIGNLRFFLDEAVLFLKAALEALNIVLFLHNIASIRFHHNWQKPWGILRAVQVLENHHCTSLPCSLKEFHAPLSETGTFQMSWRKFYSIATSMLFLDSTLFYSVPSLSYKAHQIALGKLSFVFAFDGKRNLDPNGSLAQYPDASDWRWRTQ